MNTHPTEHHLRTLHRPALGAAVLLAAGALIVACGGGSSSSSDTTAAGTAAPSADPATTESSSTEPPNTEAPATGEGIDAFCDASYEFWLPTEALDYIDTVDGSAAASLFADMNERVDQAIDTAPSNEMAAPAVRMKEVFVTLIPLLDEIDYDLDRAQEVSDVPAFGETIGDFVAIADDLESFLQSECGRTDEGLQAAAVAYANNVPSNP